MEKPMKKIIFATILCCIFAMPIENKAEMPTPRLIGGHASVTWLAYAVSPEALCAWNNPSVGRSLQMQRLFVKKEVLEKKAIGSREMGGINVESWLLLKPTAIILADYVTQDIMSEKMLKNSGIEVVKINFEKFEDYPQSILEIGRVAREPKRAANLAKFVENMQKDMKKRVGSIPEYKRLKVYYSSSPNGGETAAGNTVHDHVISYAGGINAFPPGSALNKVRFKVTFEQVLEYDPDVVIINDREFATKIRTLYGWKNLRAVKAGRVYMIPDAPVSWMDRPVSMFQLMGSWWLASKLYPDKFPEGYKPMAEKFFNEFLQIKLDAQKWKMIDTEGL
jgi:iron complex transport system substrate-binding protein